MALRKYPENRVSYEQEDKCKHLGRKWSRRVCYHLMEEKSVFLDDRVLSLSHFEMPHAWGHMEIQGDIHRH